MEGRWQTAGEAKFTGDIPFKQGELHAAFVLSDKANCDVESCDASKALEMTGVVAFINADDVPGQNGWKSYGVNEEIFSSGKVNYAGQSIGLVLAETREIALEAARRVKVTYANQGEVVCDIETAAETPSNIVEAGPALAYGNQSY